MSLWVPVEYDPEPASVYVTEPVYDGVAVVAERGCLWVIASDDELRVLNHLPQDLNRGRKPQLRDQRQPRGDESQEGAQHDTVENVDETLRVQ